MIGKCISLLGQLPRNGETGSYSESQVGFEDIGLSSPRTVFLVNFRIAEDSPATRSPGEYVLSQHKKYMSMSISPSLDRL
jgi:hypothetical protein